MFKHRHFSTPTKLPNRDSSTPYSSKKPQSIDPDDGNDDDDDDNRYGDSEDEIEDYDPSLLVKSHKSSSSLKVIYIVSQSDVELELDTPPSTIATTTALSPCNDKVVSVHLSKAAANAAAKKHLRKLCKVKSRKDAEARQEAGGYHEGVGTKGLFVGSMKTKENYVRVETQWWKVGS